MTRYGLYFEFGYLYGSPELLKNMGNLVICTKPTPKIVKMYSADFNKIT